MKTITKLAAVAFMLATSSAAFAGKGGSFAKVRQAVQSGSQDAIIAEVERIEGLTCPDCVTLITQLTEDNRVEIRQVAAWWFGKRPALKQVLAEQMTGDLANGSSFQVRNAADFLGRIREYKSLPALRIAITRGDLSAEAKLAIVRAVGYMAHLDGNSILVTAMHDGDATVRAAAVDAWRDVLGQKSVTPVVGLLSDADAHVRAEAAIVVGAYADATARTTLEHLVTTDADVFVRKNAAFALGKIGDAGSRDALYAATSDKSGLVSSVAKIALGQLH
jgi:HEAT repeat protein